MAPHSSTPAWKIPWTEEPGRLQSTGSQRVKTRLSDFTFAFHFHALEKEMATHSSVLTWRIPETGEPGELPSMGSHRVGHDWSDLAAVAAAAATLFLGTEFKREIPNHSGSLPKLETFIPTGTLFWKLILHFPWEWQSTPVPKNWTQLSDFHFTSLMIPYVGNAKLSSKNSHVLTCLKQIRSYIGQNYLILLIWSFTKQCYIKCKEYDYLICYSCKKNTCKKI